MSAPADAAAGTLVLAEEERLLADAARGFMERTAPVSRFRAMRDAGRRSDPELWAEMAGQGFAGVLVPEAAGGSGMGHLAAGIIAHEGGRVLAASPFISTAVIAATVLARSGGAHALKALGRIAEGRLVYAVAVDERSKFDPAAVQMTTRARGNGFVLDGAKTFVAHGLSADRLLVLARTGDGEGGLTLFDLPADREGIAREPMDLIDARDAARIRFAGVEVSGDEVVGEVGGGLAALGPGLRAGQAAVAAELGGVAAGAFGMTRAYLQERRQFGVPIGSFQALQHRAAHLWCELEITTSAILNAGRVLDAEDAGEAAQMAVSLAKARAAATARLAVNEGVQMHGGIGMTDAFDMGFFMKRARVLAEWLGDYGYHAAQVARARGF